MIENRQLRFPLSEIDSHRVGDAVEDRLRDCALRWYIAEITDQEVVVEATLLNEGLDHDAAVFSDRYRSGRDVVVSVVPTGVGCEVGGYAGDAAPISGLLSHTADYVVTNPNALNASNFIHTERNILYTEGLCLDRFVRGEIELFVPAANRVGLILEKSHRSHLEKVFNVVNTVRAVNGVDVVACEVTDGPIGSRCERNPSGAYVGTVDHPEQIFRAAERLVARGAQAIAITTNIQDLPHDEYVEHFEGRAPNPMGGVEAIISHLLVDRFALPAAHAPMINLKQLVLSDQIVDARGAGEMASESGLACVLIGLARAPQMRDLQDRAAPRIVDAVNARNVLAVVAPAGCLGGIPMIYADRQGIPIIAVRDNRTILNVTHHQMSFDGVIEAQSYAEAAGFLLALRQGIDIRAISRPLTTLRPPAEVLSMPQRPTMTAEGEALARQLV